MKKKDKVIARSVGLKCKGNFFTNAVSTIKCFPFIESLPSCSTGGTTFLDSVNPSSAVHVPTLKKLKTLLEDFVYLGMMLNHS